MGYRKNPASLDQLRALAKERFFGHRAVGAAGLTLLEAQHLFEEFEIHQIELELQNEHLNAARAQLEVALNQSSELYDFAPVGIFSLDPSGAIVKLNLAGANLLGGDRAHLLGTRFEPYVTDADRTEFEALLARAVALGDVQNGEIALRRNGPLVTRVQIQIASLPETQGLQIILVDVTQTRQAEERLRLSEERWKLALEAAGDGVWDWNVQTGDVVFSKRFRELFGFPENEYGHDIENWNARIHPDDKARVMADIQAHLRGNTNSYLSEHRGQCRDGSWKWVLSRGAVVNRTEAGRALRMLGTHVDISVRKGTEEALLVASRFQQAVFDSLAAQIVVLDRHGRILQANAAWCDYALHNGYLHAASDVVGANYRDMLDQVTGHDPVTVAAALAGIACVVCGEFGKFQLVDPFFAPADQRWFSMKVTPVHDAAERVVVSHEDVSSLKAAELASLTLANIDSLTGALSRRNFFYLADQEMARSTRYDLPLMVLMVDLDHFKRINDRHGHAAGDAVLQGFVQTVRGVLRESDLIGRLGGEEFAVLLPNTTPEGGQALAQRIIDSVRTCTVEVAGEPIPYTVSIGAGYLSGETSFASLLGQADTALYRAKDGGRDRLEIGST